MIIFAEAAAEMLHIRSVKQSTTVRVQRCSENKGRNHILLYNDNALACFGSCTYCTLVSNARAEEVDGDTMRREISLSGCKCQLIQNGNLANDSTGTGRVDTVTYPNQAMSTRRLIPRAVLQNPNILVVGCVPTCGATMSDFYS